MDHLPLPREPLLDPIEVPYRCTEPYDGNPMLDYPERNGWRVLYSPAGITYLVNGEKPSDNQMESFIQNYLYFGLLHDTFGKFVDITKFIATNESGRSVITTAPLDECLWKWAKQVEDQQDAESSDETDWWVHTHKLLVHAWKVALNTKKVQPEGVIDERIWFSLALLAESIQQVMFDLFRDPMRMPLGYGSWRNSQNPSVGQFILDEMLEKGWCVFDVHRISLTTKGAATLYFLGNLQPTRPDHDHSKCTKDLCVWMATNDSYKTRHATPDCHCESRFSGIEGVRQILEGDEIPLIQETHTQNDTGSPEFRIIPGVPSIAGDFVAISHVWAEGLGNPRANELPNCSLKWIADKANSLNKESDLSIPFWIDTICVPITPHNLWLRAMNRLRKPYTDAAHVLVLDSYLYSQDSSKLSPLEIWARVLCCSWSRRLWTFQEGRLAKTLMYQFADRAISLEHIFIKLDEPLSILSMTAEMSISYRSSNIIRSIGEMIPDYPWKVPDAPKKFRPNPNVRDMRESLQARSVSVIDDEALCLFCNMGFDMELVTDLAPEERMPKFWSLVKDIPVGLIFSTAREKLSSPGLHWAPASFMGDIDTRHWYLEQEMEPRVDGFPTSEGLEIQVPAFLFDPDLLKYDESFDVVFADCWFTVQDQADQTWYFVEMLNGYWNQDRKEDPKAGEQLAILLHKPVDDLGEDTTEDPFSFLFGIIAVIGVITEPPSEDRPSKIEVYRHAYLHKFSPALQEYNSMIQIGVERFVTEQLGYFFEARSNEGGRFYESLKKPEYPEGEEPEENLDNFETTPERRDLCQQYCTAFAEDNPWARDITLKHGYVNGKTPQESFEDFGLSARFQFQMRRRNGVRGLSQTQLWCID